MQLSGKEWGAVLGLSWGGSALGTVCFTQAVKLGSATTAVLLQELQPLFAALLSGLLLGELEPRRPIYWMRTAVALTAAYFISFGDDMYWPSLDDVRGQSTLLAVLAAAIWGSSTVFGRYAVRTLSPLAMTALRITVALPLLALLNGLGQSSLTVPAGVRQWGILATMALVPGLAALVAYYYGLRRTHASLATLAELCFPAGAVLINWVFLGERISPLQAGAVALLWVAVLWGRGGPKDRGAAPLPPESRA
jgi:drug/metabolite transporter (DMT)-like permease